MTVELQLALLAIIHVVNAQAQLLLHALIAIQLHSEHSQGLLALVMLNIMTMEFILVLHAIMLVQLAQLLHQTALLAVLIEGLHQVVCAIKDFMMMAIALLA